MSAEVAALLREPFKPEHMGKLPKITCGACRGTKQKPNPAKVCERHEKQRCRECRNWITSEHMHLDYVGHAEVTDRLNGVDPLWTWEPMAFGPDGLPAYDRNGGMWIRLTIAGVTRPGYGAADGKSGGDAVKEIIGDAIRNGAMRFGVAVDLWGAKFKAAEDDAEAEMRSQSPDVPDDDWDTATPIGRGNPPDAPAERVTPPGPLRPIDHAPKADTYNPQYYTSGVTAIGEAKTHRQLDELEAQIGKFRDAGMISDAEAGRLALRLGERRDILREPPPGLADAIADQALATKNQETSQ